MCVQIRFPFLSLFISIHAYNGHVILPPFYRTFTKNLNAMTSKKSTESTEGQLICFLNSSWDFQVCIKMISGRSWADPEGPPLELPDY